MRAGTKCQTKKIKRRSSAHGETRSRANRLRHRPESLSGKKSTMFAKASMARVPSNRPSPSDFPRRGGQESSFNRPKRERRQTRYEGKRRWIWRKRDVEARVRNALRQLSKHFNARASVRPRTAHFRPRRVRLPAAGAAPIVIAPR
jgi:hypothetical protein